MCYRVWTHFMLGVASPKCDNQELLQILPEVPWWGLPPHPPLRTSEAELGTAAPRLSPLGLAWEGEGGDDYPPLTPLGGLSLPQLSVRPVEELLSSTLRLVLGMG